MTEWNEATLRGAASWKAFKEGKTLFENGAVTGAKATDGMWSGSVREGKRTYRTAVKLISVTNLETRCGCPENQSTGAVCAHGVAVGLAVLNRSETPVARPSQEPRLEKASAFDISFPPNWMEALRKGKLSATLTAGKEMAPADERISEWLAAMGQAPRFPIHLHLVPERITPFLRCLMDHPRVIVSKLDQPLEVREGARLSIESLERQDDQVILKSPVTQIAKAGGNWWRIGENELARIGPGTPEPGLESIISGLTEKGAATVSVHRLLENLERWQEWLDFPQDSWLEEIHFVPARSSIELSLEGSLQQLEGSLRVRYASSDPVVPGRGAVAGLPRLAGDHCEVRDWHSEGAAVRRLERWGFEANDSAAGTFTLRGESKVLEFLSKGLPPIRNEWEVREGSRFKLASKQVVIVEPKIDILGSGEDWLSFNLSFQSSDGSIIPTQEVRRLLIAGKGGSGKKLMVSESASNIIEPLFAELDLEQQGGVFTASLRSGEVIKEIRNKLLNVKSDSTLNVELDGLIQADLRPYQTDGANWLIDRSSRFGGALLADDMGLGKTIQSIALIEYLFSSGELTEPILVIATASLLGNWKAEFQRFAPGRSVRILHGAGREKEQAKVNPGEVILTTFGTLPRDLAWYLKRKFKAVIVDEASLMRNPDTDHAKAIGKLEADARIALTGTPIENGVRDLWSIFRFIQPGWLGNREEFRERYELQAGDSSVMERLRLKISPFMLRRTKEQVAPELPSKILIEELCDLTAEQQSVYRDLLTEGRKRVESIRDAGNAGAARMQVLTALLRLRQTCCDLALLGNDRFNQMPVTKRSAKLQRLLELIGEAVSGGHKILVFSQFRTQLLEIQKCLGEVGIDCLKLDGQTRNRQDLVNQFQSNEGPPVFLISLKAGGYGLNLTAADVVIHFDPWWNPAAEAQATDRAHRIGQTRPVTIYRLISRGTVEEKVINLQAKKREVALAIDEGGAGDAAGWSDQDLRDLLQS
jgi:superfamily II DNA or RNA helicase